MWPKACLTHSFLPTKTSSLLFGTTRDLLQLQHFWWIQNSITASSPSISSSCAATPTYLLEDFTKHLIVLPTYSLDDFPKHHPSVLRTCTMELSRRRQACIHLQLNLSHRKPVGAMERHEQHLCIVPAVTIDHNISYNPILTCPFQPWVTPGMVESYTINSAA